MLPLALMPEWRLWTASLLALAAFLYALLVLLFPTLFAKSADPADRGMAMGCYAVTAFLLAFILGIGTTLTALLGGPAAYSTAARLTAYAPLAAVLLTLLLTYLRSRLKKVRKTYAPRSPHDQGPPQ